MLPVFLRRLRRGRVFLRNISKNCFISNNNCFQSFYISTDIMPPKRKAAALKAVPVVEEDDLAAGGDQTEPPAIKTRRGKDKDKEVKEENTEKKAAKKPVPAAKKLVPAAKKEKSTRKKKSDPPEDLPAEDLPAEDPLAEDPPAEEPKTRGRKTQKKEKPVEKPSPSNSTITKWDKIKYNCTKKNGEGQKANLKISCWNIGGLKSWTKKDCLKYLEYEDPDIFCVQETKCNEKKLPEEIKELDGYEQYWCASDKEGYAGVGLLSKVKPITINYGINIPELDEDGRCITAEFKEYYVVCVYVPNAGRKLVTLPKRLEWNTAFKDYVKALDVKKPVIICGDMNVAHNEIDLARPANNTKNAGFTQEERDGMTDFLQDGYIDTFRKLYPEKTDQYTFWTYLANSRAKNVGWRLDYFIVSERIMDKVCDTVMRSEVLGSDHCPITLFINI